MKNIKLAVLGGGSGMAQLLKGLKKLPFDLSSIVSVCDDGKSTGRLREEFNMPAMGDIRKVLVSLSEDEEAVNELFNYRFTTSSDLDGHALGNLLLTGAASIKGNLSDGIDLLNSLLKLKGNVLPLSEDNAILMGKMDDGSIVEGEHNITLDNRKIVDVFYKNKVKVNQDVITSIKRADAIVLSMGSVFTSILPNLICDEIRNAIDSSKAKIIYVCNIMTQPGETDDFKVSDHVKLINRYLGKRKVEAVLVNNGVISTQIIQRYSSFEQKDLVVIDEDNLTDVDLIMDNYFMIEDKIIRHNSIKVAIALFSYLIG